MGRIVEGMEVASWSVRGFDVYLPVVTIRETGGNRLVERERPYRDGAKLDDTGAKARRWSVAVLFENTIEEPGLEGNGGLALFPDVWRLMRDSFAVHETGSLTLPTVGKVRARAESWESQISSDDQDAPLVTFSFVEDNEEAVGAASYQQPTANANARRLAETTEFDQESLGANSLSVSELVGFMSELEGLANAPADTAQELEWTARRIGQLAKQSRQAFQRAGVRGRDVLLGPRGSRLEQKLVRSHDMAARSAAESRRGRPAIVRMVVGIDTSLFHLCALIGQPVEELLAINPQLESPFFIPAGSEVRVFASATQPARVS